MKKKMTLKKIQEMADAQKLTVLEVCCFLGFPDVCAEMDDEEVVMEYYRFHNFPAKMKKCQWPIRLAYYEHHEFPEEAATDPDWQVRMAYFRFHRWPEAARHDEDYEIRLAYYIHHDYPPEMQKDRTFRIRQPYYRHHGYPAEFFEEKKCNFLLREKLKLQDFRQAYPEYFEE